MHPTYLVMATIVVIGTLDHISLANCAEKSTRCVPSEYATIAAAIEAANEGDRIIIAAGEYQEHDLLVDKSIQIASQSGERDVTVNAGEAGRGIMLWEVAEPGVTIRNLKIINARTEEADWGAGIYVHDSHAVIEDCEFRGNGTWYGGGIGTRQGNDAFGSDITVRQCLFTENHTVRWAPAIAIAYATSALIEDCDFLDNTSGIAGAVAASSTDATNTILIKNCRFGNNRANGGWPYGRGGAIFMHENQGSLSIESCAFWNNSAAGSGDAIYTESSAFPPNVYGSLFCGGDPLEIISGTWIDSGENVFHGECNGEDCNGNLTPDLMDIMMGTSQDVNLDSVPDECQCLNDINADQIVNIVDLLHVIAEWGGDSLGDVTYDGIVDADDVLSTLAGWGACP
jgi:hypothetical protein